MEEIRQAGGQAIGVSTDFRDVESVTKSFEAIKKELGDAKLAAAIYNVAGGRVRKPFLELTQKEFEDGIELNGYVLIRSPTDHVSRARAHCTATDSPRKC